MASPSDFANTPPGQPNAYGPAANDDFAPGYLPVVEKQMPMASRLIREGEAMDKSVASGITKRIK